MSYPGTAREHLDWAVERAMEYHDAGETAQAFTSFASDVLKHDGTAWIARHEMFGRAVFSPINWQREEFCRFLTGWAVSDAEPSTEDGAA